MRETGLNILGNNILGTDGMIGLVVAGDSSSRMKNWIGHV